MSISNKDKKGKEINLQKAEKMEAEIENLVFHAAKQMRKGFISAMILATLKEQNLHGYGIMKEIETKTQGVLTPMTSSIYPVLADLTDKKLVKKVEEREAEGKTRKIYHITEKGERMLKRLIRQYQEMISKLRTITMGAFGFDGNYPLEEQLHIMSDHPLFGWKNKESAKEKEENLIYYRNLIDEHIHNLEEMKNNILEELEKLKKK